MKRFFASYWFLLVAVGGLAAGLLSGSQGLESVEVTCFALSSAVGFALSIRWLIQALREGALGSDVLAAISIGATSLTGEWLAGAVISLMLASGRALESWAEGRAHAKLEALLARAPREAHLVGANGITDVALERVALGNRILVRSGEVVPLDGTLIGSGTFDESALTGEPLPVYRVAGEEVASGVVNSDGPVEIVTTQTSETSTYASLVRLVAQAQASSSSAVRLANRWAVWFVPFSILLALGTWMVTGQYALAVAVIVAATPCPLILAVPVAVIAGMSKAASAGAIIKGGAALESLARASVVLLDKTGTLTHGGPEITSVSLAPGWLENDILRLAASLEQQSSHVVAKAFVGRAIVAGVDLRSATDVSETHGHGLSGVVEGCRVEVGQPDLPLPEWANTDDSLLVAVKVDGSLVAIYGLDDPVREESRQTIDQLRLLGVKRTVLVSGDRTETVASVANMVGVDAYHAECKPDEKLAILKQEKAAAQGTVVVIGDGINDAPALAASDVGVAMGARGATAASEAADVVIVEDSIAHLATAVDIAQGARRRALQAAGVGMALAIGAMLAAAFGLMNATQAAVSQELIDASAILWALVPAKARLRN